MAIYHFTTKPISRSEGRSAVACAAYRAGARLTDIDGKTKDYRRKREVSHSVILTPYGQLARHERGKLWQTAERAEFNKDGSIRRTARTAREIEMALPRELTADDKTQLACDFAQHIIDKFNVVVDVSIHKIDGDNPHVHLLISTRIYNKDGTFGGKARELDNISTLKNLREKWADHCNAALAVGGFKARVDHRSLTAQGMALAPMLHVGAQAKETAKRRNEPCQREQENAKIIRKRQQDVAIQLDIQKAAEAHLAKGKALDSEGRNLRTYADETARMAKEWIGGMVVLGKRIGGKPTHDSFTLEKRKQTYATARDDYNKRLADWRHVWEQLKGEYLTPEQKTAYQEQARRYGIADYEKGPDKAGESTNSTPQKSPEMAPKMAPNELVIPSPSTPS